LARTSITRDDITTVTPESRKYCLQQFASTLPAQIFDPWGLKLKLEMPGTLGGANWSGASFDPSSGYLFVNTSDLGVVGEMKREPDGSPRPTSGEANGALSLASGMTSITPAKSRRGEH